RRPQPVRECLRERSGRALPGRPRHAGRADRRGPPAAGHGRRLTVAVPWRLDDADHDHSPAHDGLARHGRRYADILDAIGHTPLVEIPRMSPNPDVHIFAKLEMLNP